MKQNLIPAMEKKMSSWRKLMRHLFDYLTLIIFYTPTIIISQDFSFGSRSRLFL